jgi:hypothetical protein
MKCSGIDVIVYILPEMCGLVYLDIFFKLEEISEEYTKRCIPTPNAIVIVFLPLLGL